MRLIHNQFYKYTKALSVMFVMLTIISADLYGQNKLYFPGFFNIAGGVYNLDRSFDDDSSDNIPVFGAGIGLGTSQHMYAFANFSYSFASVHDSIEIKHSSPVSHDFLSLIGKVATFSNIRQFHFNFGIYRNIFSFSRFDYSIMGGMTIYKILRKSGRDESFLSSFEDKTLPGFFLGMGGDYGLRNSNLSIFLDGIWNITVTKIVRFPDKEGGYSISTGLRYHFKRSRSLKKRVRPKPWK